MAPTTGALAAFSFALEPLRMADTTLPNGFPPGTQGATYVVQFNIRVGGATVDLTTYASADLQFRPSANGPIVAECSTAAGTLTLAATAPNVVGVIPAGIMAGIAAGTYQGELKLVDGSGNIDKPVGGSWQVIATITP